MPRVSVVIPAYNCERFISTAIDSVLGQTYRDFEIVVVNDGSTDGTDEILSGYGSKIKKICQQNKGPAGARNAGVANASGEYIAFLDQDDAWLPDKLKLQLELFDKNDKLGLVYTDTYIVDDGRFDDPVKSGLRTFSIRKPRRENVFKDLFLENFISTSSVMVRKDCILKAGDFDPSVVPSEDYDMWLRVTFMSEADYVAAPLVKYRDHVACFRSNKVVTVTHIIDVLNKTLSAHPSVREELGVKADRRLSACYAMLADAYIARMRFGDAFRNFSIAAKLSRSPFSGLSILAGSAWGGFLNILRYFKSKIVTKI